MNSESRLDLVSGNLEPIAAFQGFLANQYEDPPTMTLPPTMIWSSRAMTLPRRRDENGARKAPRARRKWRADGTVRANRKKERGKMCGSTIFFFAK
jgi:hypothetical protein